MTRPLSSNSTHRFRGAALLAALVTLAACGDSPTVPQNLDREAVAVVMPSVTDARQRLAPRLADAAMRARLTQEIGLLASALTDNNVHQARLSVDNIGDALIAHRPAIAAGCADGSDLTAIELMLYAVAPVVRNTRYDIRFKASS